MKWFTVRERIEAIDKLVEADMADIEVRVLAAIASGETSNPVWERHCSLVDDLHAESLRWADLAARCRRDRIERGIASHIELSRPETRPDFDELGKWIRAQREFRS